MWKKLKIWVLCNFSSFFYELFSFCWLMYVSISCKLWIEALWRMSVSTDHVYECPGIQAEGDSVCEWLSSIFIAMLTWSTYFRIDASKEEKDEVGEEDVASLKHELIQVFICSLQQDRWVSLKLILCLHVIPGVQSLMSLSLINNVLTSDTMCPAGKS